MPQAEQALSGATLERLLSRTTRTEAGCLEWAGSCNSDGYGLVRIDGRVRAPHRVAYQLHHGVTLTSQQHVCHSCDNPPCINPDHLWLGDASSNHRDCAVKGRSALAKLTPAKVSEIRARHYSWGRGRHTRTNAKELAAEYGVAVTTIWDIAARRTWTGVA